MASNNFILGLDIGTTRIKAAVGEIKKDGQLLLSRVFRMPSAGMRKGVVDDLGEATRAINSVLFEVKKGFRLAHKNIFLNTGGVSARVQSSRGIVAVSRANFEIYKEDIERAIQASQAISLSSNRMIVHAIIREFIVDGVGEITDPMGMTGNRLEANSLIIDAFTPAIKNLNRAVETSSGGLSGLIFGPLASASAVLSKNQRQLGVVLIDIGAATTSICVYEDNRLLHIAILPVGCGHVTNDLAIGLKTSIETAEAVKTSFGYALAKNVSGRDLIDLAKIDSQSKNSVSRRFVSEIVEMRLAEILEWVNNELKHIGKAGKLPAGAVLVGGGAKMPGLVDLTKQELRLPAQIGVPDLSNFLIANGDLNTELEDPEYACCLGLLLWGKENSPNKYGKRNLFSGSFLKKIFGYFVP